MENNLIMNNLYQLIQNSEELIENNKYYWGYQYRLANEVLVPYLKKNKAFGKDWNVAEIGCAEGGVLAAFVAAGAKNALGTDIMEYRIGIGKKIAELADLPIEFKFHNIIEDNLEAAWKNSFDLVILRDVIEHLEDTRKALENIRQLIKPGGFLFVTFPPFHSPFGGHQHTIGNNWGALPYIHLLPKKLYLRLISSGRECDIDEINRLLKIKLTPKKFLSAANQVGYKVFHSDYYLLRPVFRMKFGLPPIKLTGISFIPFIKKYFSLEASYILQKI